MTVMPSEKNPKPPKGTRRSVRERVDLLLELAVDGRDSGAANTGAVQVLERREQGRDTRLLLGLRVAGRERDRDAGVVDRMACRNVRVEALQGEWDGEQRTDARKMKSLQR